MSFTTKESKSFPQSTEQVFQAAEKSVTGLEGKILEEDAGAGTLKGQFDKKIHGKLLGDRSQILVTVKAIGDDGSTLDVEVYPINPVGQPLMFGARKGVSQTIVSWFWSHMDHHLG